MNVNDILNTPSASTSSTEVSRGNDFGSLKTEDFMQILIAELSNQDPLEPMDNEQILNQVQAINEVNATQSLVETLGNLSLSQGLGSASNLIGKEITAEVGGVEVSGIVDRAEVEDGEVFVSFGDQRVPLSSVTGVSDPVAESDDAEAGDDLETDLLV
ncbi:Basal-body rod modification protein FlgD [Planctomycetes bacterium Pan216]|uniref:Basal-body rod modification protein FlgD n=1 Tax=Kolteria novifilia TaxID=2527975 RepID=A0A518B6H5_9BACT|nr:Basal-body rod modification protein FlgD [Planctomycetes bacterium Pan216]